VDIARYHDIPAPDPEFLPDQLTETVTQSKSKGTLAREKAREVWKGAKPIVEDCFYLDRADNASIPEGAFWEQQAYFGMRSDMHPHDGAGNFAEDSTRQRTPSGDSHRLHTATLGVDRVRMMLQETSRTLVAWAKSKDKMGRKQMAAIDITKGSPWGGHVERDEDGTTKSRGCSATRATTARSSSGPSSRSSATTSRCSSMPFPFTAGTHGQTSSTIFLRTRRISCPASTS